MTKRIVWICTFSNAEKRKHLFLWRNHKIECGQWIPNLLSELKKDSADIDLHLISVEPWMRTTYQQWTEEGITFHCIPESFPVLGCRWPGFLPIDVLTNYATNSRRIARIVESINPDIIHLFGAENPNYATSVLSLKGKYPILIGIQGFFFREPYHPFSIWKVARFVVESRILQSFKYYIGEYESREVVRVFNRSSTFFHLYFPIDEALAKRTQPCQQKKYDLLFVARLVPQKGILDFVRTVALIRRERKSIKAAIVGGIDEYAPLKDLINTLDLSEAISFLPRFPSQVGLFELFRQSTLFVAPTYNDCFPSTIRESAFLGTPVIAYATGGIPYANQNGRLNVVLVEPGDVEALAGKAIEILDNAEYRKSLSDNLRELAATEFSADRNVSRILDAYSAIKSDRKKGAKR
jgi:glycosyltransferase involved in cell wall biosynthesis